MPGLSELAASAAIVLAGAGMGSAHTVADVTSDGARRHVANREGAHLAERDKPVEQGQQKEVMNGTTA